MGLPSDIASKATKALQRQPPPTVQQVLTGDSPGAASAEALEGVRALGQLSARQDRRSLKAYAARREAVADAKKKRDDAILAELRERGAIS